MFDGLQIASRFYTEFLVGIILDKLNELTYN